MKPSARRMIEDMTIRHFVARTQTDYIRTARTFAAFLGPSPDQAEPEDFRRFQSLRVRMRSACGLAQLQWSVMVGSLNWERHRQGCPGTAPGYGVDRHRSRRSRR
jgi:hypothetical protein